ncbi:isoprenylcysteine carboxylmethyltransferase family protein [Clostridium sp. D2Q-11]|uniref:Isoprenylcysteine carboxylmethyltransferase family protein n=1 Tax=Anaeromonas frigoriresistens TaxID=2683708 RepID=A0A942V3P4_9FIRM|nr:isoprenylcysteine carboxylmethyltransferase family protein [Anaeromonas frigoriresistens]MBS4539357.1 isoprenylcysteine carboxylmethyltransferase family protein [Anaeromonas frigoriresistens]
MEEFSNHFHNWFGVLFFIILYGIVILFIPFYRKMDKKPIGTYIAFVIAFAIEMHGIPFSMYLISGVLGKNLPEGVLWGHTLFSSVGHLGLYISYICSIIALFLILNGWHNIYKNYWSKSDGKGELVKTGVYKHVRHPQYTGLLLLSFGMIANWATLPLLIMYPVMIGMYVRLAKREEKDMIMEFGNKYREYMKSTKMFIPYIL